MTRIAPGSALLLAAALLGACTSLPESRPAPASTPVTPPTPASRPAVPPPPANLAAIPDAMPKDEPRSRYGNPASYVVFGQRYFLQQTAIGHVERGTASWYGPGFHAARTSSGEPYDMYAMTAAHKTLPIPAYARVTNLLNGRSVVVRINDRGPFVGDRIVDLSYTAAWKLDMLRAGTAPVELRVLTPDESPSAPMLATTAGSAAAIAADSGPAARNPGSVTWLQVGAFFVEANARQRIAQLKAAGISNAALRPIQSGARPIWQARLGPFANEIEIDDMLERLRLLGVPEARRVQAD